MTRSLPDVKQSIISSFDPKGHKEAQAAMKQFELDQKAAARSAEATALSVGNFSKATSESSKVLGQHGAALNGMSSKLSGLAGAAGFGGLGIATLAASAAVGLASEGAKQAVENYEKLTSATKGLQAAFKSQGLAVDSNVHSVEQFLKTNSSYIDDQYAARDAIALMVRATGDQKTALRAANDAIDISVAKGIPYAQALEMVNKGIQGQARGLLDLGVSQKEINKLNAEAPKAQAEQAKATTEQTTAGVALTKAQEALKLQEDELHGKRVLSTVDLDHLKTRHDAVTVAEAGVTKASQDQAKATADLSKAGLDHTSVLNAIESHTNGARSAATELSKSNNRLKTDWQDLSAKAGPELTHMLDNAVTGTDRLITDMGNLANAADRMANATAHAYSVIANPPRNAFVSSASGGVAGGVAGLAALIGGIGGPQRAGGGPVVPNRIYTVGERGPEQVAFGAAGHVYPTGQGPAPGPGGSGGGGDMINNFYGDVRRDEGDRLGRDIAWRMKTGGG